MAALQKCKKNFFEQSSTRNVIERALGMLKGRFLRLKLVEMRRTEDICKLVMGACVLHNFCINEIIRLNNNLNHHDFPIKVEGEVNNFISYGSSSADAERKRKDISLLL